MKNNLEQNTKLKAWFELLREREKIGQLKSFKNFYKKNLGRVFFRLNLYGSITGRITTSNCNIQGSPYELGLRKCIISILSEGVFLDADFSQEEVRILAEATGDEEILRIFREGKDFHTNTGAVLNKSSYEDFDALKETSPDLFKQVRKLAKKLNFGLVYGMSYKTLQKNLEMGDIFQDLSKTKKEFYMWHNTYKSILPFGIKVLKNYWKSQYLDSPYVFQSQNIKKQNRHYITSMGGRLKRDACFDTGKIPSFETFKLKSSNILQETLNFPIQATGSDILTEIWLGTLEWDRNLARVILVVYDEFVIETLPQNFKRVKELFNEIVYRVGKKYLPTVGLIADSKEPSKSWDS